MKVLIGLAIAAFMMALTVGVAEAQGTWNAIALDMAGGYNLVTGADSEEEAKQQAIDGCGNESCQSIMATESLCLAIADTPEGDYQYGWSYGNTKEGVEHIALGYCFESGYLGCETLVAQCIVAGQSTTPAESPGPKTKSKG